VALRVLEVEEGDVESVVLAETLRPFAFEVEAPVRALWLRSPAQGGRLLLVLHHALVDWATLDLLLRDLAELYAARAEGRPARLAEPVPQARDFARWQRTLPEEALETLLLFWRRELGGDLKALELPTDRPRPAIHTFTAARHRFRLPAAAVQALAAHCGQDAETVLLAAFETVLHRWAGHGEIVVGTVHPGREVEGTADLAGPVANLLVLRASLAGDPPFGASATALERILARARRHAALPFDRLVLALRPEKDMSRTALFDVLFQVASPPAEAALPGGLLARREDLHLGWGKYDLYLCLTPGEGEWDGGLVYNADLFDPATADRLARHFATLVEAAAAADGPETPVSRLPLLSPAERAEQIAAARPRRAFAGDEPLHRRFRRHAQAQPAAPAVAAGGEILSYGELARRVDGLAAELRRRGVGPESRVGVCAGRSGALIEAILAVQEAGGAYVPLDPGYPREHLAWILADSGARWVMADRESAATARDLVAGLPSPAPEVLDIEARRDSPGAAAGPGPAPHPDQAAYVIYTSGSTGRPKGCLITHRNAARLFDATADLFAFGPGDTVPLFHSYAFDFSVWEIGAALACGGRLVVVPDAVRKDPAVFAGLLVAEGVTVLNQTPSAFYPLAEQLAQTGTGRLRAILFGGEALDFGRLRPFFQRFGEAAPRLWNLYGITETTVHVTAREVTTADVEERAGSRIGSPLADLDLYVIDPWGEPQPEGLAGELWVGGAGLARGYLGRPDLTADRFRPHPFSEVPGARLYRSGDLARRTADGDVEYQGRADHQVKIRGFRIEPGEIEAALAALPGVRGALVMVRDFGPGDRRLVAWIEPEAGGEVLPAGELRRRLLDRLPPHMVPAAFVRVERFPLTANGKIDRDALPAPDRRGGAEGDEVAPRTPVETELAEIWKEVLGLERVGVHDDFFELGGDSILSIQILSRAARAGLELTTQAIFQHPTIAGLAAVARPRSPVHAEQGPVVGEVLPTPIQAWFFDQDPPRPDHFNQSVLLAVRGADPGRLERALETLAVHHDALRLRARREDGGWRLDLLAPEEARLTLERVDLSGLPAERRREALEQRAAEAQASLDLAAGRSAAAVLFDLGGGEGRLLLAMHHLAIDGVSWRILLEDLDAVCRGLDLPPKTTSVLEWARRLHERAASPEIEAEIERWLEVAARPAAPAAFAEEEGDRVADEASVTARLPEAATAQLLGDALRAYGNRAEDILLAGLVTVLGAGGGLRLDLEGHGRVALGGDHDGGVDLGRTLGWLTALYPVWLDGSGEPGSLLKAVKERLRGTPSDGIGYGLLRHLRREPRLAALPASAVLFNFHGRADLAFPAGSPFGPAPESPGPQQDPAARRTHALEITGLVTGGVLELTWTFSAARHRPDQMAALAGRHLAAVEELIRHCLDPAAGGYTPSDFPEAGFTQEELEDFLSEVQQPD
jgi:amino acid adenylation domain-containing protein/non-ribosomal peptide synthase protein (TIGR01720 family)